MVKKCTTDLKFGSDNASIINFVSKSPDFYFDKNMSITLMFGKIR